MFGKKGQLGVIEFKFFMIGLFIGIISGLALVFMGSKKIIPFQIPFVCGFFKKKKGQLMAIEFHFFLAGFVIGVVGAAVLVYLGRVDVIPFKFPVC
jgi:hypothetical protein